MTYLSEGDSQLLGKKFFKVPDNLVKKLNQAGAMYGSDNKSNKGYKKLQAILNPKYNDRTETNKRKPKDGTYVTYADLKNLKDRFKKIKNPKSTEKALLGGDDTKRWVNQTLNRERTRVSADSERLRADNIRKSSAKPVKPTAPVKPVKPPKANESYKTIFLTVEQAEVLKRMK